MKDYWIKVFRTGKHTDSSGNEKEWTEDDLKSMVDSYNSQPADKRHDAPLRAGDHSNTYVDINGKIVEKPAFGYVRELKSENGEMFANVLPSPELIEGVRTNRFKKVSIGLKAGDSKMLDHIAILGSKNPAVKGLGMLEMSENFSEYEETEEQTNMLKELAAKGGDEIEIKFQEKTQEKNIVTELFEMIKNFFTEAKKNTEPEKEEKPEEPNNEFKEDKSKNDNNNFNDINNKGKEFSMDEATINLVVAKVKAQFGAEVATGISGILKTFQTKTAEKKENPFEKKAAPKFEESDEFNQMQKKIQELERQNRQNEFSQYIEKNKEKITPAMRPAALVLLQAVAEKKDTVMFEEKEVDAIALFKQFVEKMPPQIPLNDSLIPAFEKESNFSEEDKAIEEFNKKKGVA